MITTLCGCSMGEEQIKTKTETIKMDGEEIVVTEDIIKILTKDNDSSLSENISSKSQEDYEIVYKGETYKVFWKASSLNETSDKAGIVYHEEDNLVTMYEIPPHEMLKISSLE